MSLDSLVAFLPELTLLTGALVLFAIALGVHGNVLARRITHVFAFLTLAASLLSLNAQGKLFAEAYRVDAFSQLFKLILAAGFVALVPSLGTMSDIRDEVVPEYFLLLFCSVAGLFMAVSCMDLIALVIALELASFPMYLMLPMRRDASGRRVQMESAIKYIMFGVGANGLMLFGLSYLYGLTGTLHLPAMIPALAPQLASPVVLCGFTLLLCGCFFKLAVFPFHFWSPDVYQGGSHETTTIIASIPKLAAMAVLVRLMALFPGGDVRIATVLAVLAAFSMSYGNLLALVQDDVKRLLGFSAIAHAGYSLIGVAVGDAAGYSASLFYMAGYLPMILACFAVVVIVAQGGVNPRMSQFSGLHARAPVLAATMAVGMLGLSGLPPFVGFIGKLTVLKAALARGYLWLALIAVVNSAVAIYYYLQVVREMYLQRPDTNRPLQISPSARVTCVALIILCIGLGIMPDRLLAWIDATIPAALLAGP